MKKTVSAILLTGVFAAMPAMVAAASQEEAKTEPSKEIVLNKFKDNWMISLEGGVDFSLGRFDSHADFGKRIAPVFGLNVEKWFSPVIGLRLGADYYGMKGAALWGNGMSGEMLDNTYYKQSYALITPALDVMGDLASLFCGYRERVYSPILYVGMGMGLATMFVLICSNVVISLIKNLIPDMVRIPSFIVVIASFVTLLQMVMQAYVPGLYATLGLFIPLIVVNCIVLGRAEAFAAKNNPIASFFDGLGMGLGFTIALTLLGAVREFLGTGKVFDLTILPEEYGMLVFVLAPGAFIALGYLIALINSLKKA